MHLHTLDRLHNPVKLIAMGIVLNVSLCLTPSDAQQPDPSASTRSSAGPKTGASGDGLDPRMASFQARAQGAVARQQIVAREAEGDYHKARLEREIAEIRLLD